MGMIAYGSHFGYDWPKDRGDPGREPPPGTEGSRRFFQVTISKNNDGDKSCSLGCYKTVLRGSGQR